MSGKTNGQGHNYKIITIANLGVYEPQTTKPASLLIVSDLFMTMYVKSFFMISKINEVMNNKTILLL